MISSLLSMLNDTMLDGDIKLSTEYQQAFGNMLRKLNTSPRSLAYNLSADLETSKHKVLRKQLANKSFTTPTHCIYLFFKI